MTPSDIEKSRKEFHEHCAKMGFSIEMHEGGYLNLNTFRAWHVWQASRESLVVELPQLYECDGSWTLTGYDQGELHDSLQSAGINYRERE